MNLTEIKKQYANEDLEILIENGCMAITETLFGVVFFDYENGIFKASKNDGTVMIETNRKKLIHSFIMNCYQVA
jgi:hypothetical protein